jgi:hypothetical protein
LITAIVLAGVVGVATAIAKIPAGLHSMAFHGVVNSIITVVLTVGSVCLAWHAASRHPAGTSP